MIKKGESFYPSSEVKKRAWLKNRAIYKEASANPQKMWNKLALELQWMKKWRKVYAGDPPHFSWFVGAKSNITQNCLDRHLKLRKNKVAMIWEPENVAEPKRIYTYYDLYREVCKLTRALKKLGVKKGDRVGIYLPMIPEVVISMLACARLGAVHSVVFSAFSSNALQVRLEDAQAKILITADGYYRRGKIIELKKGADEGLNNTAVKKVIVVKRANIEVPWQEGRDVWYGDIIKDEIDAVDPVPMDSEDPLFILYTSGSTGKPKGCVHVCGGYMVQAYATDKWIFDINDEDIFWSTADIGWVTGHTYSCYGPLLNGATFLIFEGLADWPNADRWAQVIDKYGVTTFYTAPTAIRMFMKNGTDILRPYRLDTLQVIASVGEPISEKAWLWYFNEIGKGKCPLLDTWWQTETGGIIVTSLAGMGPFKPAFTGLPFPGVRVKILDDEGKECKDGKEGNLVLLPPFIPGLLRGIYNNEKKYLETYWSAYKNKMYISGDLGYRDKNGLIRVVGRADDQIKVAGHRLTTGEMESALAKNLSIAECAIVGVADEIKGEVPVVFVVSKTDIPADQLKAEVIRIIREEIGPIATPKEVFIVKDLPKTRSGKIMRRLLRKALSREEMGDLSTLSNPESVQQIQETVQGPRQV